MAIPVITGHTTTTPSGGTSTFTVDPSQNRVGSSVATDDWILIVFSSASSMTNTNATSPPGDWTNIVPQATVGSGTMTFGVWAHQRGASDTTYTFSQTIVTQGTYYRMIFVSGADDIANWVIGTFANRSSNATSTTNVAPAITTAVADTLALLLSGERTVAAETDPQVTCTSFTKQWFDNNTIDHTLFVATKDMPSPSNTGSSTVTYPNTHAENGIAGIVGIPSPVAPSTTVPLMWVQGINS